MTELSIVNHAFEDKSKKTVMKGAVEMRRKTFVAVPEHVALQVAASRNNTPRLQQAPPVAVEVVAQDPSAEVPSERGSFVAPLGGGGGFGGAKPPGAARRFTLQMAASNVRDLNKKISHGINPVLEDRICILNKST